LKGDEREKRTGQSKRRKKNGQPGGQPQYVSKRNKIKQPRRHDQKEKEQREGKEGGSIQDLRRGLGKQLKERHRRGDMSKCQEASIAEWEETKNVKGRTGACKERGRAGK